MTDLINEFQQLLGDGGVLLGKDVHTRSASWRGGECQARALLRPRNTDEVAAIMKLCHAAGQTVVVQAGKTSMVEGCVAAKADIVLSMERMAAIEELDMANRTMTVQAGAILQQVQQAAADAGLQYPLDLGARGSATIGGNIATNAGGNRVIRYGMTRDLILGLEAILADGTVISSMCKVIKNNAAYDLKQLFIGSEGTLGVVTRAVLRLQPAQPSEQTALLALDSYSHMIELLHYVDAAFAGKLSAFEAMWNSYYRQTSANSNTAKAPPLSAEYGFYVLLETQGADEQRDTELFEQVLSEAMTRGWVVDAVIARSQAERDGLWAIRDNVEALLAWWPFFIFDISLPLDRVGGYLEQTERELRACWPDMQYAVFGHLGDGNIHIVASIGSDDAGERHRFDEILYAGLQGCGGSISAEHGIGQEKREFLHYSRSVEEIALMKTLKRALDPKAILNPAAIFC